MTTLTRSEQLMDEYNQAPQLLLIFPASRQTWHLRLTPEFARWLAAEVRPYARLRARNGQHNVCTDLEIAALVEAAVADTNEDHLRAALRDLVPDFANNLTPNNGVPSLTDPPRHRKGRPSGEMHQLV